MGKSYGKIQSALNAQKAFRTQSSDIDPYYSYLNCPYEKKRCRRLQRLTMVINSEVKLFQPVERRQCCFFSLLIKSCTCISLYCQFEVFRIATTILWVIVLWWQWLLLLNGFKVNWVKLLEDSLTTALAYQQITRIPIVMYSPFVIPSLTTAQVRSPTTLLKFKNYQLLL